MNIINAIGTYFWNILKSIGAILWTIATGFIKRTFLLVYHIISGPYYFVLGMIHGIQLLFHTPNQWPGWFGKSLLALLAWTGRIVGKALDILLLGEILDLLFQIVKPNQRTLTELEQAEAQKVFGQGLIYWQIRIDEASLMAWLGARFAGTNNMGVTTFHTINFTRKIKTSPGNSDMEWLIHELAHISQMDHAGIQYIVEALVAQYTGGYNYGEPTSLSGKKLKDFNREQQAEIAADYYQDVLYGNVSPDYFISLIEEFRNVRKLWF